MIELFKLDHSTTFPCVSHALRDPNGLLAFGGDLSPQRLISAYKAGIFPWFSEGEPLLWWSPDPRGVIFTQNYSPGKSLKKSIRKENYTASMNMAFDAVIEQCAQVPRKPLGGISTDNGNSTWITAAMSEAYQRLHQLGYAHSVEIWDSEKNLVGGLYGVGVNGAFSGESMFHLKTDASKAALWALVCQLQRYDIEFVDCQMVNPHLASLGCVEISRNEFLTQWKQLQRRDGMSPCWQPQTLSFN